jgi:hypothetical protein
MPVSSDIYSQVQAPQQINPLASLAQAYQIKAYQGQNERADREAQSQNMLLKVVQDPAFVNLPAEQKAAALQGVGAFPQAASVITSNAAANKDARAASTSEFELRIKQLDAISSVVGTVKDQPSYTQGLAILKDQLGIDTSKFSPTYDPNGVAQFAQATLSAKDRLANQTQLRGQDITMRGQDLTQSTALAGQDVTRRGQDMTQSTALQGQGVTMRGQDLTDRRATEANQNGRVPSGYRQNEDGTLAFIPGGPADPAAAKKASPTEFQGKSATFGSRAQEADRILSELGDSYSPAAVNAKQSAGNIPLVGGVLGAGANMMLGESGQKAEQAQRDFVNAVLRQESGAAIGKDEFDNAKKQYFPQPGDGKAVIEQKAANRRLVIEGFKNNAGNAPIAQSQSAPKTAAPTRKTVGGKTYENDGKGWYVVN